MASTPAAQKSALNVVLGAMTFGEPGIDGARVENVQDIEAILDIFVKHGHSEVRAVELAVGLEVDTARAYCAGTSEAILGKTRWQEKRIAIASKLYPFHPFMPEFTGAHTLEGLRKALMLSLETLNTEKLEIWYLHGPDRSVPYEVTLKAIDELYREGHFKRFGISNYMAWEVAEMVSICKRHGYVQPAVYQGIYNAIHRLVEPELFPALRKFGIAFYGFNPLAGGFFTDRYKSIDAKPETGSAFDPERFQGKSYRGRYWKAEYFDALAAVRAVASAHGLTMAEVALRWVSHHSLLRRECGDAVLIGGSNLKHIEENLTDLEKGPLPDDLVAALDAAWTAVKATSSSYHH
ncbi:Aflatoxin B1 aldehyde reductase member 3 [Mycena venus]|uniref:Aflatoxin B1 aldehyde reductase member 3 n=1 Tax=Mycena venus TaxID=2733690 RepID=A0A8H7CRG7_9AGAR|nr:Aflatoxin B1 aldehyde reductase member 3 [Mycena venus]